MVGPVSIDDVIAEVIYMTLPVITSAPAGVRIRGYRGTSRLRPGLVPEASQRLNVPAADGKWRNTFCASESEAVGPCSPADPLGGWRHTVEIIDLAGRKGLVFGIANEHSLAWA